MGNVWRLRALLTELPLSFNQKKSAASISTKQNHCRWMSNQGNMVREIKDEWEESRTLFTTVLRMFLCLYCVLPVTWMWKCLCLGLTNEHYQDDTRLFGGTRPQSFPLVSAAVIYLLLGSFKEALRVTLLCYLIYQAQFNRQQLSLIL